MVDTTAFDEKNNVKQAQKPVRVIAVTGGKGGVGKTTTALNLSISLAKMNQRVMLLDADMGLANVDIMLGLHTRKNIAQVLQGECDLQDILIEGPSGVSILPAASGLQALSELSVVDHTGLIQAFSEISTELDYLIIDTVICDEPPSITDAYALMKVLSNEHNISRFQIVSSQVENAVEGRKLFGKLLRITEYSPKISINYLGEVPYDESIRKAIREQRALVQAYPESKSGQAFYKIAKKLHDLPLKLDRLGKPTFFLERVIHCLTTERGM